MSEQSPHGYITAREFADELRKPIRYIYGLTTRRRIRYFKVGKEIRFRRDDVDEFMESISVPAASGPVLVAPARRGPKRIR